MKYNRSKITKRAHVLFRDGVKWSEAMKTAWDEAKGHTLQLPPRSWIYELDGSTPRELTQGNVVEFRLLHGRQYRVSTPGKGTLSNVATYRVDRGKLMAA